MPDLYFFPMACSLSSRIAAYEAGVELNYRHVNILAGSVLVDEPGDLHAVSAMGKVPVLVTDDGDVLSENATVLQYIADLNPASGLAPAPSHCNRYHLQKWLSLVGTELHKGFCNPTFSAGTPDPVKTWVRAQVERPLAYTDHHLEGTGDYLIEKRFTVADAYLIWALLLIRAAGLDLDKWPAIAAYVERVGARPHVGRAISLEWGMSKASRSGQG